MKKATLFLILFVNFISAQTITREMSDVEKILTTPNLILEKTVTEVGNFANVKVNLVEIKNLETNDKVIAFNFFQEGWLNTKSDLATLDQEEIDKLIKFLEAAKTKITSKLDGFSELIFLTRTFKKFTLYYDSEIAILRKKLNRSSNESLWKIAINFDENQALTLNIEKLDEFINILTKGKSMIK